MKWYVKILLIGLVGMILATLYCYLYYPQQTMPFGEWVYVETPEFDKYRNDCLHPCIRYDQVNGEYHMIQSPYYGWNNKVENPIYYKSKSYMHWSDGVVLAETPATGYNSDPCILLRNDSVICAWRECGTPLCDSLGCTNATVGGFVQDGQLAERRVIAINYASNYDVESCPIIINQNGNLLMYAAWYQYYPNRVNKGVAVWDAKSIDKLDFNLRDSVAFSSVYTVDKCAQVRTMGRIWYVPKPLKHDLWHFDLFEYNGKMYMVSVAEKGDNIMLSVAEDRLNFKTYRKPLINNHYMENYTGYRQYFYKPTAFVKNDSLFVFYTANAKDDPNRNQLFVTKEKIAKVID